MAHRGIPKPHGPYDVIRYTPCRFIRSCISIYARGARSRHVHGGEAGVVRQAPPLSPTSSLLPRCEHSRNGPPVGRSPLPAGPAVDPQPTLVGLGPDPPAPGSSQPRPHPTPHSPGAPRLRGGPQGGALPFLAIFREIPWYFRDLYRNSIALSRFLTKFNGTFANFSEIQCHFGDV